MFLSKDETDYSILRQGDVLKDVHILGAININAITYGHNINNELVSWHLINKPLFTNAMVLSHSCEIDPKNKEKTTSIILGAFRDIDTATSPEKVEELIESNLIDDSSEFSYLKYFYVKPHEELPYPNGSIVDFSKCFSVRNNCYDVLVSNKILQLKPEIVEKMSIKLAYYFHRG